MQTPSSLDNPRPHNRPGAAAAPPGDGNPCLPYGEPAADTSRGQPTRARLTADELLRFGSDEQLDWPLIGFWIAVAGGLYPVLVAFFLVLRQIVERILLAMSPPVQGLTLGTAAEAAVTLLTIAMMMFVGSAFFYVGAFLVTGLVSVFVLPVVALIVRTLELRAHPCWIGAMAGGAVGYVATVPFVGIGPQPVLEWLVGPALATVLGQLGGFYGGWASSGRERWLVLLRAGLKAPPRQEAGPQKFQYGVRHLLWLTLWCSAGLTFLKLLGLLTLEVFVMLCAWGAYSLATLLVISVGLRRWLNRRLQSYDPSRWRSTPIEQGQIAPRD